MGRSEAQEVGLPAARAGATRREMSDGKSFLKSPRFASGSTLSGPAASTLNTTEQVDISAKENAAWTGGALSNHNGNGKRSVTASEAAPGKTFDVFDGYGWRRTVTYDNCERIVRWYHQVDRAYATRVAAQRRPDRIAFAMPTAGEGR